MTTFRLTLNCDGAELHDGHPNALARTLVELGHAIAAGRMPETVRDVNGNTVGRVEFGDFEPVDMDRVRELVGEFADDLGNGAGIGDCTMVDSSALRALYNLVFGIADEPDEPDEPAETVRCRLCGLIIEVDDVGDWHDLTGASPYACALGAGTVHEPDEGEYPPYPCPNDPDGQHHADCGCEF